MLVLTRNVNSLYGIEELEKNHTISQTGEGGLRGPSGDIVLAEGQPETTKGVLSLKAILDGEEVRKAAAGLEKTVVIANIVTKNDTNSYSALLSSINYFDVSIIENPNRVLRVDQIIPYISVRGVVIGEVEEFGNLELKTPSFIFEGSRYSARYIKSLLDDDGEAKYTAEISPEAVDDLPNAVYMTEDSLGNILAPQKLITIYGPSNVYDPGIVTESRVYNVPASQEVIPANESSINERDSYVTMPVRSELTQVLPVPQQVSLDLGQYREMPVQFEQSRLTLQSDYVHRDIIINERIPNFILENPEAIQPGYRDNSGQDSYSRDADYRTTIIQPDDRINSKQIPHRRDPDRRPTTNEPRPSTYNLRPGGSDTTLQLNYQDTVNPVGEQNPVNPNLTLFELEELRLNGQGYSAKPLEGRIRDNYARDAAEHNLEIPVNHREHRAENAPLYQLLSWSEHEVGVFNMFQDGIHHETLDLTLKDTLVSQNSINGADPDSFYTFPRAVTQLKGDNLEENLEVNNVMVENYQNNRESNDITDKIKEIDYSSGLIVENGLVLFDEYITHNGKNDITVDVYDTNGNYLEKQTFEGNSLLALSYKALEESIYKGSIEMVSDNIGHYIRFKGDNNDRYGITIRENDGEPIADNEGENPLLKPIMNNSKLTIIVGDYTLPHRISTNETMNDDTIFHDPEVRKEDQHEGALKPDSFVVDETYHGASLHDVVRNLGQGYIIDDDKLIDTPYRHIAEGFLDESYLIVAVNGKIINEPLDQVKIFAKDKVQIGYLGQHNNGREIENYTPEPIVKPMIMGPA